MKKHQLILGSTAVFSFLFYNESIGINLAFLAIVLLILIWVQYKNRDVMFYFFSLGLGLGLSFFYFDFDLFFSLGLGLSLGLCLGHFLLIKWMFCQWLIYKRMVFSFCSNRHCMTHIVHNFYCLAWRF